MKEQKKEGRHVKEASGDSSVPFIEFVEESRVELHVGSLSKLYLE